MSNFSQKEKKKILVLLYHRYCWDLKSIFFDIIFINIMYQLIPKAPTPPAYPGYLPKIRPARWGIWLSTKHWSAVAS